MQIIENIYGAGFVDSGLNIMKCFYCNSPVQYISRIAFYRVLLVAVNFLHASDETRLEFRLLLESLGGH